MKQAYLFSFVYWFNSPPKYILSYGEDEETARETARQHLFYNNGEPAKTEDVISCTHGL